MKYILKKAVRAEEKGEDFVPDTDEEVVVVQKNKLPTPTHSMRGLPVGRDNTLHKHTNECLNTRGDRSFFFVVFFSRTSNRL